MRPHIADWDQVGPALIHRIGRESVGSVKDPKTQELITALLSYPRYRRRMEDPESRPDDLYVAGDSAQPQRKKGIFLHGHHRDTTNHRGTGAADRVLVSGGRNHRSASPQTDEPRTQLATRPLRSTVSGASEKLSNRSEVPAARSRSTLSRTAAEGSSRSTMPGVEPSVWNT